MNTGPINKILQKIQDTPLLNNLCKSVLSVPSYEKLFIIYA
jgi:hypothetical protein